MKTRIITSFFCTLLLFLIGCATPTPVETKSPDYTVRLDFLEDGKMTKTETLLKLGQPSGTFEKEMILTYRLGRQTKDSYYLIDYPASWRSVHFSLVLVFDERGLLQKHSLVPIR
jgi:hypothetical protein